VAEVSRWRSNTQAEYEAAETELARRQDEFLTAADAHFNGDPGDPDLAVHEWPSYMRATDAARAYLDAATHLSRLRP
jgi:hypothetical protein